MNSDDPKNRNYARILISVVFWSFTFVTFTFYMDSNESFPFVTYGKFINPNGIPIYLALVGSILFFIYCHFKYMDYGNFYLMANVYASIYSSIIFLSASYIIKYNARHDRWQAHTCNTHAAEIDRLDLSWKRRKIVVDYMVLQSCHNLDELYYVPVPDKFKDIEITSPIRLKIGQGALSIPWYKNIEIVN